MPHRRPMGLLLRALAVAAVVQWGCSDPGDGSSPKACAKGLKTVGAACIPIFDDCKGDAVPILGGGCKRVGPPAKCLTGWAKVKRGWCEPILPDKPCPPGTMEMIGKASCQPVGLGKIRA